MPSMVIEFSLTTTEQWPGGQRQESWEGRGHKEGKQGAACTCRTTWRVQIEDASLSQPLQGPTGHRVPHPQAKGLPQPEIA